MFIVHKNTLGVITGRNEDNTANLFLFTKDGQKLICNVDPEDFRDAQAAELQAPESTTLPSYTTREEVDAIVQGFVTQEVVESMVGELSKELRKRLATLEEMVPAHGKDIAELKDVVDSLTAPSTDAKLAKTDNKPDKTEKKK